MLVDHTTMNEPLNIPMECCFVGIKDCYKGVRPNIRYVKTYHELVKLQ